MKVLPPILISVLFAPVAVMGEEIRVLSGGEPIDMVIVTSEVFAQLARDGPGLLPGAAVPWRASE